MDLKLKILDVAKANDQSTSSDYLQVHYQVTGDGEVLADRFEGFPLNTTKDEILVVLQKQKSTILNDLELAKKSAELEAANKSAGEVIEQITGAEL